MYGCETLKVHGNRVMMVVCAQTRRCITLDAVQIVLVGRMAGHGCRVACFLWFLKRRSFWKDNIYCKQVANEEQYMKISSGVGDLAVKDVASFRGMSESMTCLHIARKSPGG